VKKNWQLILFGLIHAVILLFLFNSGLYHNSALIGDIKLFFEYSSNIIHGLLPYRNFTVEYPPLALVFFTIPRLTASTLEGYRYAFTVEILIFNLIGLYLLSKLSNILKIKPLVTLMVYTLLLLSVGPLLIYRFDIIPAVMVLGALYAFTRKKYFPAWVILAVGTITKIYPIVIAPIFLIYELSRRRYQEVLWEIALSALITEIVILPFFVFSASGFINSISLQLHRGLQLESTYSSFLLLMQNWGLAEVYIKTTILPLATSNIISGEASVLSTISPLVLVAILIFIYWRFFRKYAKNNAALSSDYPSEMAGIIYYSFLVILVFVLTNNVFSPQYLIWFVTLAALISGSRKYVVWCTLIAVCFLTYYEFPLNYALLQAGNIKLVYVLLVRNILLIILAGWLIEWRQPVAKHASG
jgi:uncharacterized membrane protein